MPALWSQNYDREILQQSVHCNTVKRVDKATPCQHTEREKHNTQASKSDTFQARKREQLFTIHGLQLTAVHTLFRFPNPSPILVHLLLILIGVSRVPNGMRSGRDEGRGFDQLKSRCGLLSSPVQPFHPYNTKTLY